MRSGNDGSCSFLLNRSSIFHRGSLHSQAQFLPAEQLAKQLEEGSNNRPISPHSVGRGSSISSGASNLTPKNNRTPRRTTSTTPNGSPSRLRLLRDYSKHKAEITTESSSSSTTQVQQQKRDDIDNKLSSLLMSNAQYYYRQREQLRHSQKGSSHGHVEDDEDDTTAPLSEQSQTSAQEASESKDEEIAQNKRAAEATTLDCEVAAKVSVEVASKIATEHLQREIATLLCDDSLDRVENDCDASFASFAADDDDSLAFLDLMGDDTTEVNMDEGEEEEDASEVAEDATEVEEDAEEEEEDIQLLQKGHSRSTGNTPLAKYMYPSSGKIIPDGMITQDSNSTRGSTRSARSPRSRSRSSSNRRRSSSNKGALRTSSNMAGGHKSTGNLLSSFAKDQQQQQSPDCRRRLPRKWKSQDGEEMNGKLASMRRNAPPRRSKTFNASSNAIPSSSLSSASPAATRQLRQNALRVHHQRKLPSLQTDGGSFMNASFITGSRIRRSIRK